MSEPETSRQPDVGRRVDLNADVGEGFDDSHLLPLLSSANVACGAHAGDATTMAAVSRIASAHAVSLGAHPSFPDREGFGRRAVTMDPGEIERLVLTQVKRFAAIAAETGNSIHHVKPHGALYNLA